MRELSALQLQAHLENCKTQPSLLDVRQPWEFEICKIAGSMLIPVAQIPAHLESLDSECETVVICHHGIRSRRVGHYLEQAGFKNIINLSGGVKQWSKTVDSHMSSY